jgi:hypothetical protein
MIRSHNPLNSYVNTLQRILHRLNALQNNCPVPMLLQELHILPPMTESRKDRPRPTPPQLHSCPQCSPVPLVEMLLKHRFRKPQLHPYVIRSEEGILPIIHITRPPARNICIKRYKKNGIPRFLCPLQQRDGDQFY